MTAISGSLDGRIQIPRRGSVYASANMVHSQYPMVLSTCCGCHGRHLGHAEVDGTEADKVPDYGPDESTSASVCETLGCQAELRKFERDFVKLALAYKRPISHAAVAIATKETVESRRKCLCRLLVVVAANYL